MDDKTVPALTAESLAELPELPEPFVETDAKVRGEWGHFKLFTADQMRSYALAAIQREREAAARKCVAIASQCRQDDANDPSSYITADECAAAIRKGV